MIIEQRKNKFTPMTKKGDLVLQRETENQLKGKAERFSKIKNNKNKKGQKSGILLQGRRSCPPTERNREQV